MGPFLIHNKTIRIMDSVIRTVAYKRYEADMGSAHKILFEFFEKVKFEHFSVRLPTKISFHNFPATRRVPRQQKQA